MDGCNSHCLGKKGVKGMLKQVEVAGARIARSRSPRGRSGGVKSFLKSWAIGDITAVGLARFASGIVTEDQTDAGIGMSRLAGIASMTSSSDKNCSSKLIDLLSLTGLDKMVRPVPHAKKEMTITHHLRPSDLIRLIHCRNRTKFHKIFGTNKAELKAFWESLFSTEEGREFKELHPALRLQQPEDLKTTIPIVVHEDAAPYGKKRSVTA